MKTDELTPERTRLIRFVIVGGGAALLLFSLTFALARAGVPAFWASTAGYAVAFVVAYTAQRGWTFGGGHDHRRALPRYLAVQLGCAVLSGLVAHVAAAGFDASPFVLSLASTLVASAVSYLLTSRWVFAARA